MRKLIVAMALLVLVIPAMASANTARTAALASGDARFLPDDSRTAEDFPGRIHEHHRITFENVDPASASSVSGSERSWGGFTMEHERVGGTIGWFVDRPHAARRHQLESQSRFDVLGKTAHSQVQPASSIVDLFWGNESWGFTSAFGMSSEEFLSDEEGASATDTETYRNVIADVVLGKNLASGTEVAGSFFLSRFGELDGDNQSPNAFGVGANLRHPMDLVFFNHLVAGGSFAKDVKFSNADSVDAGTSFTVDANLLNFTKAGGEAMGGGMDGDLTYLLALGVAFTSAKDEGVEDRINTITLPKATAGAELDVASWLTVRGSVTHSWNITSDGDTSLNGGSGGNGVSTTLGAGLHWGKLTMDMVVNNGLLTAGPNFVGGRQPGVANFVTLDWAL